MPQIDKPLLVQKIVLWLSLKLPIALSAIAIVWVSIQAFFINDYQESWYVMCGLTFGFIHTLIPLYQQKESYPKTSYFSIIVVMIGCAGFLYEVGHLKEIKPSVTRFLDTYIYATIGMVLAFSFYPQKKSRK